MDKAKINKVVEMVVEHLVSLPVGTELTTREATKQVYGLEGIEGNTDGDDEIAEGIPFLLENGAAKEVGVFVVSQRQQQQGNQPAQQPAAARHAQAATPAAQVIGRNRDTQEDDQGSLIGQSQQDDAEPEHEPFMEKLFGLRLVAEQPVSRHKNQNGGQQAVPERCC